MRVLNAKAENNATSNLAERLFTALVLPAYTPLGYAPVNGARKRTQEQCNPVK